MPSPLAIAPFDITQWMTPPVRQAYTAAVSRRRFYAGQIIYVLGDEAGAMYRIVSGSVRVFATRGDGREVVFVRFEPGDAFGESSLIDHEPRPQTAHSPGSATITGNSTRRCCGSCAGRCGSPTAYSSISVSMT